MARAAQSSAAGLYLCLAAFYGGVTVSSWVAFIIATKTRHVVTVTQASVDTARESRGRVHHTASVALRDVRDVQAYRNLDRLRGNAYVLAASRVELPAVVLLSGLTEDQAVYLSHAVSERIRDVSEPRDAGHTDLQLAVGKQPDHSPGSGV